LNGLSLCDPAFPKRRGKQKIISVLKLEQITEEVKKHFSVPGMGGYINKSRRVHVSGKVFL
jgi:hypothetical protein